MTDQLTSAQVGANIRRLRNARSISLIQMAEILRGHGLDLSKSGLSRMETGQRPITVDQMGAIASAFGISASELLGLSSVVYPDGDEATTFDADVIAALDTLRARLELRGLLQTIAAATITPGTVRSLAAFGAEAAQLLEPSASTLRDLGDNLRAVVELDPANRQTG